MAATRAGIAEDYVIERVGKRHEHDLPVVWVIATLDLRVRFQRLRKSGGGAPLL
jgi:hypothetical protein